MGRITRATLRSWWLAALLSAGCTSYQKTSLTEIESRPDKFVNKQVRAHYAASGDSIVVTGRTARARGAQAMIGLPDSSVALRVGVIRYPILSGKTGRTFSGATLYDTPESAQPVCLDLTGSRKVEVEEFSPARTLLLLAGITLIGIVIYQAVQEADDEMFQDLFGGIYGEPNGRVAPPARSTGGPQ